MNDWIIFVIFVVVIIEIIFITFRIKFNEYIWLPQKIGAIVFGALIGAFHLIFITNNAVLGDPIIFYWGRLLYELYVIVGIGILFIINSFVSKLIDKCVVSEADE